MHVAQYSLAAVRSLKPYQPGLPIETLAREMGLDVNRIIKLASNENPLGMSAGARKAAAAALEKTALYPDGNGFALKFALSQRHGVSSEQIVLGNGSNDILELVARAFLHSGRSAVFSQYAFAVYPIATIAAGGTPIIVPAADYAHDLAAMAKALREDTRVVFIANPNNPTGSFIDGNTLHKFIAGLDPVVVVVLDEAYTEYLSAEQAYDSVAWLKKFPNLVISRTFSKAYGLAGLRVGYGLASAELIDILNRVRQPFNVNSIALAAAEAALADEDFIRQSVELNCAGMVQLQAGLTKLGLTFLPSAGNFITVRFADAAGVNQQLLKQGIIVRPLEGYNMPEFLRITIGTAAENSVFLDALHSILAA